MKYQQIVRAVSETPWAILPAKLNVILDIVAMRAEGERLTHEEIQARIGGKPPAKDDRVVGAVAIIPVYGVMIPRADMFSEISGATSVTRLIASVRSAAENPQIGSILLDVDSPGGSVFQIPELAAEIRKARESKRVVAVAGGYATSAAYWIASQADEFVASPSAIVGSIGIYTTHVDWSRFNENLGVAVTYIHAGDYKVERNSDEPLTDEARAAAQTIVDDIYGEFVGEVAGGRGVSREAVLDEFGQGRVFTAHAALKRGMVDRVDTLEATIERLVGGETPDTAATFAGAANGTNFPVAASGATPTSPPPGFSIGSVTAATSGFSFADQAAGAHVAVRALIDRTRSLAEVRDRGRLSATKRELLADVLCDLSEAYETIDELLAETNPNRDSEAARDALVALQATVARSI